VNSVKFKKLLLALIGITFGAIIALAFYYMFFLQIIRIVHTISSGEMSGFVIALGITLILLVVPLVKILIMIAGLFVAVVEFKYDSYFRITMRFYNTMKEIFTFKH
jgi:hypothetical protein